MYIMILRYYKYILIVKSILFFIGIIIISYAFFYTIYYWNENIKDGNLILIVDISHSMNTRDIIINKDLSSRLDLVKFSINNIINSYKNKKIWLMIFSKKSNYFIPPTLDHETILTYTDNLNTALLPAWWSNIYNAIKSFVNLWSIWDRWIMFSDMWDKIDFDSQNQSIKELPDEYRKKQLNLTFIWVWSKRWWIVLYPNEEPVFYEGNKIESQRFDQFWEFLAKEFWTSYDTIDESNDLSVIVNNHNLPNTKNLNLKLWHILWALFIIFGI